MKTKVLILLFSLVTFYGFSQEKKPLTVEEKDNIVMTWNRNTPESEMKDDIKALAEYGVTINYSDVKRNSKGEITGIKVTYSDRKGNKGNLELNNQKPINTIKFFKHDGEIGFGEPSSDYENAFASNDFMKPFRNGKGNHDGQSFSFSMPGENSFGKSSSKIIIKKDDRKPLVIEDGEVVEGGDDYTKEEIEEIKKNNRVEKFEGDENGMHFFNFDMDKEGFGNMNDQMKRMQEEMQRMIPNMQKFNDNIERKSPDNLNEKEIEKEDLNQTKEDMLKAKEEMQKARKELEDAKKELEKAKSSLKIQKA